MTCNTGCLHMCLLSLLPFLMLRVYRVLDLIQVNYQKINPMLLIHQTNGAFGKLVADMADTLCDVWQHIPVHQPGMLLSMAFLWNNRLYKVLWCLLLWINQLPLVCWYTLVYDFKWHLVCKFGMYTPGEFSINIYFIIAYISVFVCTFLKYPLRTLYCQIQ